MRIEHLRQPHRIDRIRPHWERLLNRSRTRDIFLTPQWFSAWRSCFGDRDEPRFLAMWEKDDLVGLCPLVKTRRAGVDVLRFSGSPVADRMSFVIAEGREERCIAAFLDDLFARADWDLLSLRDFSALSGQPALFGEQLPLRTRRFLVQPEAPCHYIPLCAHDGFQAYATARLSRKFRKTHRNMRNRLLQTGRSEWEFHTTLDNRLIAEMAELDACRSSRGLAGEGFFNHAANREFLARLKNAFGGDSPFVIVTCRIDGVLCGHLLMFLSGNRLLAYQTAFDRRHARLSIGSQAFLKAIELGFSRGCEEFDFLRGGHEYKKSFTDVGRENTRLTVYRGSPASRALHVYHRHIKPLRRKAAQQPIFQRIFPDRWKKWDL